MQNTSCDGENKIYGKRNVLPMINSCINKGESDFKYYPLVANIRKMTE